MKSSLIKLAVAGAMLLFGCMAANAHPQFDPDQMAQMQVDQLKETVKLDEAQSAKVLEIFKENGKAMGEMFQGGGFDMDKMQKLQADRDKKLKEVLGDDNFAKFQKAEQERMQAMMGGGFGGF